MIAFAFAISASVVPMTQSLAAGERLGAACTTEGVFTGTKSTSLVCVKTGSRLTWQKVKLASGGGAPVRNLTPPKGEIEFWHYRPEPGDQRAFVKIIADFEAMYPGTKIKQVFTDTTTFNNTARVRILQNPKAALIATSRGAIFNQYVQSDMFVDLTKKSVPSSEYITSNSRICMTDMWRIIDVIDRSCHIEVLGHLQILTILDSLISLDSFFAFCAFFALVALDHEVVDIALGYCEFSGHLRDCIPY